MELTVNNLDQGLNDILWRFRSSSEPFTSRNGTVMRLTEPIMVTYTNPTERVLFNPKRDANPYFHLMECLWMLTGRNDVKWISQFNKRMREFSDNEHSFHGAYGHRWRVHFGFDQLMDIINLLKHEPDTRRAVIAMWDPASDLDADSVDLPCNTHIYFDIVHGRLNMTVCNRSNDVIWGMFGANTVHMSFLQEIVAAMIGVPIGIYRQFSNNAHLYTKIGQGMELYNKLPAYVDNVYAKEAITPYPVVTHPEHWFNDLDIFMHEQDFLDIKNPFFHDVAIPMWDSWFARKEGTGDGRKELMDVEATDWRLACLQWIERREAK